MEIDRPQARGRRSAILAMAGYRNGVGRLIR